jgi:hypothetical protein
VIFQNIFAKFFQDGDIGLDPLCMLWISAKRKFRKKFCVRDALLVSVLLLDFIPKEVYTILEAIDVGTGCRLEIQTEKRASAGDENHTYHRDPSQGRRSICQGSKMVGPGYIFTIALPQTRNRCDCGFKL